MTDPTAPEPATVVGEYANGVNGLIPTAPMTHEAPAEATCGERWAILGVAHACRLSAHTGPGNTETAHVCVCGCTWLPTEVRCATAPMTGDLRERAAYAVLRFHGRENEPTETELALAKGTADAVIAELAGDAGNMPKRMAEAIEDVDCPHNRGEDHVGEPCGACLAAAALSIRWPAALALAAENARLRASEEHAVAGHEVTKEQLAKAERELAEVREENAYLQPAMRGAENRRQIWRERAEAAEAQVAALQRERKATVAAIYNNRMAHIREKHPTRIVVGDCEVCRSHLALSLALPSRPDDPEEIRRLAQATEGADE